jgi:tRNA threonylcarbamoyl adenosine modification protein YeaZ
MILAVNTAQNTHELALIDGDEILSERSWQDSRDDLERLLPTLDEMLNEIGVEKEEITEILAVTGPGNFAALRTGVAMVNALGEGLEAKLYVIDTFELLRRKAATTDEVLVVLPAGGFDVGIQLSSEKETKVGALAGLLAPIPHGTVMVVAELKEALMEELHSIALEKGWTELEPQKLQSIGEVVLTFGLEGLGQVDNVEPIYMREAKVTKSLDPWKNRNKI